MMKEQIENKGVSPPATATAGADSGQLSALTAELERLRASERAAVDALAAERGAMQRERDGAAQVRAALEAELALAVRERDVARHERSSADRRLGDLQRAHSDLETKVARLARVRSLEHIGDDVEEKARAWRALFERFPAQTVAALSSDDDVALSGLLRRVVFTGEDVACQLKNDVARVSVPI